MADVVKLSEPKRNKLKHYFGLGGSFRFVMSWAEII